jgi:hypothetical protein
MFLHRWNPVYMFQDTDYFTRQNWTYYYDYTPLVKTLEKYIDYNKLAPLNKKINKEKNSNTDNNFTISSSSNIRLVITAVNVLTAEPLVFDSDLKMAKVVTRQIQLIEKLYEYFEKSDNKTISYDGNAGRKSIDNSNDYFHTERS